MALNTYVVAVGLLALEQIKTAQVSMEQRRERAFLSISTLLLAELANRENPFFTHYPRAFKSHC